MIHLREVCDSNGDVVEDLWYCSAFCHSASLVSRPPVLGAIESGGAYPCGAESDSPDFCAECGAPIGNPLTFEGIARVSEWLQDAPFRLDPTGTLRERMTALERMYGPVAS